MSSMFLWLGLTLILAVPKFWPGSELIGAIVMIVGAILLLIGK